MGEHSPFARDRTDVPTQVGAAYDPVALEDRLRVAREQRAEAIARRQAGARPQPRGPQPPVRAAQPLELAAKVPAAPPLPGPRSVPRASAPADAASPTRATHPLVALLAVGLSAAFVFTHGAPEAPKTEPVTAEAPQPAPNPAAPRIPPKPVAPAEVAAAAVPAPPAKAAPVRFDPPQAARPPVAVETKVNPPAPATDAPPVAEPRSERILVNAPQSVAPGAIDATLAALRATGFGDVAQQATRLTIRTTTVRYYNAQDAAAAAEIAALIGPGLPGGVAEARDFSDAPSRGAPGHLEIWIAGAPPASSRRAASNSGPDRTPSFDPDQIQRLVESVFSPSAIDNLGRGLERGAASVARDVERNASGLSREIDAAVSDAVSVFQGRP